MASHYRIDPSRTDLACEFKANPTGPQASSCNEYSTACTGGGSKDAMRSWSWSHTRSGCWRACRGCVGSRSSTCRRRLDDPGVRADLVFFETGAGGAVFSTGSIAWCGSLFHYDYDNNVSQITGNVLRRFLEPTPFDPAPHASATGHEEPRGLPHA